jgi:RNA polymerase sigma-70 factor (ECF subfamily)
MIAGALPTTLILSASDESAGPAPRPTDDARADVLACQGGEREAFDRLVERYQRDMYRLCYRYVNNHHDANDLAQEVFLKAYRAIGRFRGASSFSTWLYRIAVNTCLNFRSSRRPDPEELPEALPDRSPGAADRLESEERSRLVRRAVAALPERQRATLILKVYHDLTHEEVAGILGSSVGTVKANLFHALANLRKQLDQAGVAGDARG